MNADLNSTVMALLLRVRSKGSHRDWRGRQSLVAPPLIQAGKVEGFKKEEHERNFEKHTCRDEKVAHHQTHELNYNIS